MPTHKLKIIAQLKTEILSLHLKPGTIISETTLSERFGLSRTPIRDILKQLSLEGYIDIYPQKGSTVSYIDLESVEQLIYLRSTLETKVTTDLCGKIPLKAQHELKQILDSQEKWLHQDNAFETFIHLDDAFHKMIFQISGHEFIWSIMQQFNVHYIRYRQLHMLKEEKLSEIHNEHQRLLTYLIQNTPEYIAPLLEHHIRSDVDSTFFTENFKGYIK